MQAVTMGEIASEYSQELFKADKYSDYLISVSYTHLTLPTNREV